MSPLQVFERVSAKEHNLNVTAVQRTKSRISSVDCLSNRGNGKLAGTLEEFTAGAVVNQQEVLHRIDISRARACREYDPTQPLRH